MSDYETNETEEALDIAIIGVTGRFPGAQNIDTFWQNIRDGVESISQFTDQQLQALGVSSAALQAPHFVKAGAVLHSPELFDASFFGYAPREAEIIDPQHRIFLECAWEVLEQAGYNPETYAGLIGVYAGTSLSSYLLFNILTHSSFRNAEDTFEVMVGNDKDFLSTRVSYNLNLKGPSINVQTGCSTSLVATHLACQSLLSYQCDLALAGGVSVNVPQRTGYYAQEGGIASPDGHCRAFDAGAQGTIFGSGVGIVALKRLEDALQDGDTIHAVIKGSAINNDGSLKVGYTAPSVNGQAEVIARAQAVAGVEPDTISYVETHGTGTALGDPVEVAALTKAFRAGTDQCGFCALGSVKTNIGHLDAAAGVAGLIKTVLALKHRQLPPSLHFTQPNPQIDWEHSPFFVNAQLAEWNANSYPRRAGVSSFGIGGTNAHVIVEEAPPCAPSDPARPWQLLALSARTSAALETATRNLAAYLRAHPDQNMADVAYTLQLGRKAFNYRRILVCQDQQDAVAALESCHHSRVITACQEPAERPIVFMFPGGGAQYANMGRDLYETEPVFREWVDRCVELLRPQLHFDLRELLYPREEQNAAASKRLKQTSVALPALFVIEYALAQLWISYGIQPQALIGHSLGEYVAACLAGIFSLEDALALVVLRGRLMQELPPGAMLGVALPADELQPLLTEQTALAAINGPAQCAVSGSTEAIEEFAARLAEQAIEFNRIHIDVAAHSAEVEPILEPFTRFVATLRLRPPQIPLVSNVTGTWITAAEATDPGYWRRHLRQTVRFSDGVHTLLQEPMQILLEVGPGQTLSTLATLHLDPAQAQSVQPSMRHLYEAQPDRAYLLSALGKLWLLGVEIDWQRLYAHERRHRLCLPTYPFERQRYWIEPTEYTTPAARSHPGSAKTPNIAEWFYLPSWKRSLPPEPFDADKLAPRRWLIFADACGIGAQLTGHLEAAGQTVIAVTPEQQFGKIGPNSYTINPRRRDDYVKLFNELRSLDQTPDAIVHLWSFATAQTDQCEDGCFDQAQHAGLYSLLWLSQQLGDGDGEAVDLWVVANETLPVESNDVLAPPKTTLLAAAKVVPQEMPRISCHYLDLVMPAAGTRQAERLVRQILGELAAPSPDLVVAYRGERRLLQSFEPIHVAEDAKAIRPLRPNGVYLITGGLGKIGLLLAEYLAQQARARLVLVSRSLLPQREAWASWLATHDSHERYSRIIRQIQALEALGSEVLLASADVADMGQMQAVLDTTLARFGTIHGVIHAAGLAGEQAIKLIAEADWYDCELHFRAKAHGLYVLDRLLRERPLDFCLLMSSNAAVLGGLGLLGYAAANLFMDSFAAQQNQSSELPWISVNWDGWLLQEADRPTLQTSIDQYAMTQAESVEAFRRIVTGALADQLVVSTGDLAQRLDLWIGRNGLQPETVQDGAGPAALHPRPTLDTAYAPPSNELEEKIIAIWQELLGIEQLGIDDNFFDLGGNSLIGLKVISRLKKELAIDIAVIKLFEGPTVKALAAAIQHDQQHDYEDRRSRGERRRERRRQKFTSSDPA